MVAHGYSSAEAAIAQLGERQTEDLKVPGSIPGLGTRAKLESGLNWWGGEEGGKRREPWGFGLDRGHALCRMNENP